MSELLLRSGRLSEAGQPMDLLIRDGVIERIGADLYSSAESIDLDGRFVLPGLWDHHVHFDQWAQVSRRLDVSAAESAEHATALVGDRLNSTSTDGPLVQGELLVGYGFRDALWPDTPHRDDLDAVSGTTPVVLVSGDLHCAWGNSAALAQFGLGEHPTGLLLESEAMGIYGRLGEVAEEVLDQWAADAAATAASRGLVGLLDLEAPWSIDAWTRRVNQGNRSLRVACGVWTPKLEEAIARRLQTGDVIPDTDGLVSMGPLKIITDGSLNTRTAYCHRPYPGLEESENPYGLLVVDPAELTELMSRAARSGIESAIHAIGDHANSLALQAFADSGARGSIEHAQLLTRGDLPRFAELSLVASVQPEHAMDDRDVADRYWAGRTDRAFMLRSLLDAGAMIALGSDAPVAPLDPWISIAAAVSHSRGGRPSWHPEQEITFDEALEASTAGPVVEGAPADLVIVDLDAWGASAEQLRHLPVTATVLGGRFTHDAL
ncbi:hypothetical protein SAMN05892883_0912 [Jatrophihabitans sp. GAS493]|uniref:amidohydrolase n=1 Tax=Jatrophihabitans sp. GAS493 TaxID=1907575 RepID=UPI000BC0312F|nr:amidohydrolase family protein [Jatrophihabitans sp. GAS493]SOD71383.1 hypothetical protein SAMN05892883_0912 [Jatrophihabitans sp. GAS493]